MQDVVLGIRNRVIHKTVAVPCLYRTYTQGGKTENIQEKQIQINKNT